MMLNYNNIKNAVRYAEGQAKVAKMLLKLQMGFPVQQDILLADQMDALVVDAAAASAMADIAFDPTKTVDYLGMENQVEGAELQLLNQKLGYLPSIGVSYQNNIQYMSGEANIFGDDAVDIPSSLVAGNISIPYLPRATDAPRCRKLKFSAIKQRLDCSKWKMDW